MKIVIAIDSFKGSLSSEEAGNAVVKSVLEVFPNAKTIIGTLADGGEGTAEILIRTMKAETKTVIVSNPLGEEIEAKYGILRKDNLAILEMAQASGLPLVPPNQRNPLKTSSYGTGEIIRDAIINEGCRNFIIGIGGSATNDCGCGMLSALGFEFKDCQNNLIKTNGEGLANLFSISNKKVLPELSECKFTVACDVTNPLCGPKGASFVFAPQKGAKENDCEILDKNLAHFANITKTLFPDATPNIPGSGAAGGLGFALHTFMKATLVPGFDIILKETELEKELINADLIITGEGSIDDQTAMGKGPGRIASIGHKYGIPVFGFGGRICSNRTILHEAGFTAVFSIMNGAMSIEQALNKEIASSNLTSAVSEVLRLLKIKNFKF